MIDLCIKSLSEQHTSPLYLQQPTAEELAETVLTLGNISRGVVTNVVVEGGVCVGFLAAIAVWLLNIKVELYAVDGTVIYSTCPHQEEPDAKLMLAPLKRRRGEETTLQTVSKTYEISDGERLFHRAPKSGIITEVSFRMPWDKCLSYAFGMEPGFEPLMRDLKLVGTAIGSAANLLDELSIDAASTVFGKQGYELQRGMAYYRYLENPRLRGQELLQLSFKQLPELDNSVTRTAASQALHASNALQSLLHCFHSMERVCHCRRPLPIPPKKLCECGADWADLFEVLDSKARVLKFIIKLCWLLAHADIEESVLPSFSGFQRFHSQLRNRDEDLTESILAIGKDPPDEYCSDFVGLLTSLFVNGGVTRRPLEWPLACSKAGVCVYQGSMLTLDTRSGSFMSYHILPGGIEMHGKAYSEVVSERLPGRDCEDIGAYDNCRLLARVAHATLYASWALQQTSGRLRNPRTSFSIGSYSIQKQAADALYLFREQGVTHKRCQCSIESLVDSSWQYDRDGNLHSSIDHPSIVIYASNPSNILFRQLALMESTGQECFVQGRFCLGRCLEVLKRYSTQQRAEAEDEWRETDEAHKKLLKDLKKNEKNLVEEEKRLVDRRGQHEVDALGLEKEIYSLQKKLKNSREAIVASSEDDVKLKQPEGDRCLNLKDMYIFPSERIISDVARMKGNS